MRKQHHIALAGWGEMHIFSPEGACRGLLKFNVISEKEHKRLQERGGWSPSSLYTAVYQVKCLFHRREPQLR